MRSKTGDRAVQKRKRLMKRAQDRVTIMDKRRASMPQKKSKGGKIMKAMGGKGKMAKGYSKGGTRMMMKAMGGKMAKGYAKGGAKMIKAQRGKDIKKTDYFKRRAALGTVKSPPKNRITSAYFKASGQTPMLKRQKQLVGAGGTSKLASMINKLPRASKLALLGGLTAGTISLVKELKPKAKEAGRKLREAKNKKKK